MTIKTSDFVRFVSNRFGPSVLASCQDQLGAALAQDVIGEKVAFDALAEARLLHLKHRSSPGVV